MFSLTCTLENSLTLAFIMIYVVFFITAPINNDFLLTTDNTHNKIYQISLANKSVTALDLPNLNSPTGIAYNPKSSMVVWSEIMTGQIRQAFLTGENASIIYSLGKCFLSSSNAWLQGRYMCCFCHHSLKLLAMALKKFFCRQHNIVDESFYPK